ncbi:unnamed protein product [Ceratitis capitata]|uniref:(Mediterranean fruit fly) hypothetical protein n=1 Tax=Ceratitis capitata TaxID=7213 RepID=A0A811V2K8_CERCA|nr:unnamed protein product [Ceratitis capitata]
MPYNARSSLPCLLAVKEKPKLFIELCCNICCTPTTWTYPLPVKSIYQVLRNVRDVIIYCGWRRSVSNKLEILCYQCDL